MVYFVQAVGTNYIKIGYCKHHLYNRVKTLQTGCPYELEILGYLPGDQSLESELHERYKEKRVRGEWYRFKNSGLEYLKSTMRLYQVPGKVERKPPKVYVIKAVLYSTNGGGKVDEEEGFHSEDAAWQWIKEQPVIAGYEWDIITKEVKDQQDA